MSMFSKVSRLGAMLRQGWLVAGMSACALPAAAIDFGTLRLYTPNGQAPYAEITLKDSSPIDPGDIRARVATRDAYGVAGMRYLPALQLINITPQSGSNGQVLLRLERLPDASAAPEIDLLLLVGDRMSLSLGEYRVNLSGTSREFAAAPAGARLTGAAPASDGTSSAASTAPVISGATTTVATAPAARPSMPVQAVDSEVKAALDAWANAWSQRDMAGYVAAYTPDYPGSGSHSDWVEQRRGRIMSKKKISVDIEKPQIAARGDAVVATFTQRYRGDAYSETSRKRLHFVRGASGWLIKDEEELP